MTSAALMIAGIFRYDKADCGGPMQTVSSASNVTGLTLPLGQTAASNMYTVGLSATFDALDYAL